MKRTKNLALKCMILLLVLSVMVLAGCSKTPSADIGDAAEISAEGNYTFENPKEVQAEPDAGFEIDGILDEEAYKGNNWLYLNNDDGGNNVNIAMTSYYGQKGMYFVYDVTESVPIYVNPDRASYMNSCIEMYLALSDATSVKDSYIFEIDLMPNGDMNFKKSNGKYGYEDVTTTKDKMAVLGATTKGGAVNTEECYGYCLELFIPWDYMKWLGMDVDAIKGDFVYINPAHITSNNLNGTDTNLDRYWYHYAQQNGADFTDVAQYFRFDEDGVQGAVPVVLEQGENCTISGNPSVIPGVKTVVTVKPETGYALTSILVNGEEQIQNVAFNQDGSVTLRIRGTNDGVKVSAKAEPVTEGLKTLSGKVVLNNINKDTLKGIVLSYVGPKGEKPLEMDDKGNFCLKDLEQGYYILKAEKDGYVSINRVICLNQDFYSELVLEYDYFKTTKGSCWIMDEQNDSVMYKQGGIGWVLSNASYKDFTFRAKLKFDPELAKMGTGDLYTQQRTGIQIRFSNEYTWHIDMLKEGNKYILQYAKMSGDKSVTNWKTIHTLNAAQVQRYTDDEGIQLSVMRQGNYAAIWLDGALIKIEVLDKKYNSCTAQLGFESWTSNREMLEVPFSINDHSTVNVKGSPFLVHAKSWNISGQYSGYVTRYGEKGGQWLDSVINANDVTTIARDLSPATGDYSFAYIFKFSNGEPFRIRLNHTDDDGAYRIQSMGGSTVAPAWKNAYTLSAQEAEKVKGNGIEFRVLILGTTAYVYLDGIEVCSYDLSTVVETGKPSGVENATCKVSFALDGNLNGTTTIPFKLVDSTKLVTVDIADTVGGSIVADKKSYKLGETVTLTVAGDPGYYYTEILVNGKKIDPDWDGTYRFEATENRYTVVGSFDTGMFQENKDGSWNLFKQNQELLKLNSHNSGNSGWLEAIVDGNDIETLIQDADPNAKNFSMIYSFTFANGETLVLRLNHTDSDGAYRVQVTSGSTVSEAWKNHYTLTNAQASKIADQGIKFRVVTKDGKALVYIDGAQVATLDLSKVVSTGEPSNVADSGVRVKIRMDGNLGQEMEIPYTLVDTCQQVTVNIAELTNGAVTTDKTNYRLGDTVKLTVSPDADYAQKLYINGEALMLDWKANTYSFVANENVYNITGSFEKSLVLAPSDANRWDGANQAHGVLNTYYPSNNDSWWMDIKGEYKSFSIMAKNYLPQADTIDGNGKYCLQAMGDSFSNWSALYWLTDAENAAVQSGNGVWYSISCVNGTLKLAINDTIVNEISVGESAVIDQIKLQAYNFGYALDVPYILLAN